MLPVKIPQIFAVIRAEDEPDHVLAYGMVLPDGSAYSVSWPPESGFASYAMSSAERTASLFDADLHWLSDQPNP